jgi:hypothetical protein
MSAFESDDVYMSGALFMSEILAGKGDPLVSCPSIVEKRFDLPILNIITTMTSL